MSVNFCRDCKHQGSWDCWRGVNQQVQVLSLVTGTPVNGKLHKFPPTCHEERHSLWPWRCGKKARFFELKEQ